MGTDPRGSFRTHANYLRAFATLCGYNGVTAKRASVLPKFVNRVQEHLPRGNNAARLPLDHIRRSLMNAWGTELILALSGRFATEDELVRLVNNWGAVQGYYAVYHATQALTLARGMPRPESHPKTQRIFMDWWGSRALEPLGLSVGPDGFRCGMDSIEVEDGHAWRACTPDTAWHIAGMALRTTREDAVSEAMQRAREQKKGALRKAWRAEEERRVADGKAARREPTYPLPHLTATEKEAVTRSTRAYGLIDYLYRLRIKTNYEDARMFIDGPDDSSTSTQVHVDLRRVVECVLLVTELCIRERVGARAFGEWVRDWADTKTPREVQLGLAARRGAFR